MDTNLGKYDHDILISLNLRTSKICELEMFYSINIWCSQEVILGLPCWLRAVGDTGKYIS